MTTPTTNRPARTLEYSGAPFGRPGDSLNFAQGTGGRGLIGWTPGAEAAAATILSGQDSVSAGSMSKGLSVYCYYAAGTFANGTAVKADFPDKTYLGITPYVLSPVSCLDVEPGDATPANCPAFVAGWVAVPGEADKPVIYTSAGDLQAVINALTAAGHARSTYYLFSAHWIGQHICSPAACGYPQSDATQWQSTAAFDSDEFMETIFGTVPPVALTFPLQSGDTDGVGAVSGVIHTLQDNLNRWRTVMGNKFAELTSDGDYGPITAGAVTIAAAYFGNGSSAGECDQALYNDLAGAIGIPAPTDLTVKSVLSTGADVTLAWDAVAGVTSYNFQVEYYKDGFGWVLLVNATVTGTSTTQSLGPRLKYRWRVAANETGHNWADWVSFATA